MRVSGRQYKYTIACMYIEYRWKDSQGNSYTHSWERGMVLGGFGTRMEKKLSLYALL